MPPSSLISHVPSRTELRRLARVTRSVLPRDVVRSLGARGRPPSDRRLVVQGALLVGSAAGQVLGVWCEPSVRVMCMVLADGGRAEDLRRAAGVWRAIEKLTPAARRSVRSAIRRRSETASIETAARPA